MSGWRHGSVTQRPYSSGAPCAVPHSGAGGAGAILGSSKSSQKEDAMDRTSPDILAFVALIGGLLFWLI